MSESVSYTHLDVYKRQLYVNLRGTTEFAETALNDFKHVRELYIGITNDSYIKLFFTSDKLSKV